MSQQTKKIYDHPLATIRDGKEFSNKFWDYLSNDKGMAMDLSFHPALKFAIGSVLTKRGAMARGDIPQSKKVDAVLLMGEGGWGKSEIIEELPIFINRYNSQYYLDDPEIFGQILAYSNAVIVWNNILVDTRIKIVNERKAQNLSTEFTTDDEIKLINQSKSLLSKRELDSITWFSELDKTVQDEYLDHLAYRVCRAHVTNVSTSTNDGTFKGGVKMDSLLRDTNRKLEYAIENSMLMHTIGALEEMLQGAAALPSLKDPLTRGKYLAGDGTERDIKLEVLFGMTNTNLDKLMANNDMRAFLNRFDFAIVCCPSSNELVTDLDKVISSMETYFLKINKTDKFTQAAINLIRTTIKSGAATAMLAKTGMMYAPRNIIADINYLRMLLIEHTDDFEATVVQSGVLPMINALDGADEQTVERIVKIISNITSKGSSKNTARTDVGAAISDVWCKSNIITNIARFDSKFANNVSAEINHTIASSVGTSIFKNVETFSELRNSVDSAINSGDEERIAKLRNNLEEVRKVMQTFSEWTIPARDLYNAITKIDGHKLLNDTDI